METIILKSFIMTIILMLSFCVVMSFYDFYFYIVRKIIRIEPLDNFFVGLIVPIGLFSFIRLCVFLSIFE